MFFDFNICGSNFNNNLIHSKEAISYGWDHISFNYNHDNYETYLNDLDLLNEKISNKDFSIDLRCEISHNNINHIQKAVRTFRDKSRCISVLGGDLKINRETCENIKVDILSRPYIKRKDCGLNHVLAKAAYENNVAIELCFNDILTSYLSYRSKIISYFKDIINLHRKYEFPIILTSGASSIFQMRNPIDLSYFFNEIGLSEDEITSGFYKTPKNILKLNNNRKNLILKGVKKIEGFDNET